MDIHKNAPDHAKASSRVVKRVLERQHPVRHGDGRGRVRAGPEAADPIPARGGDRAPGSLLPGPTT
jgi:hypothetical protein